MVLTKSEMKACHERVTAAEASLFLQFESSTRNLVEGTDKLLRGCDAVENFVNELKTKLTSLKDIIDARKATILSPEVLEEKQELPNGRIEEVTNDHRVFKDRSVLESQSFVERMEPNFRILQGNFVMSHHGEDILVRIGICGPEPSLFLMCFPFLEEKEPDFFGDLEVNLQFLDASENVCLEKSFSVEAFNGTCSFSSSATDIEHLNCEDPTHEVVFESDDEKRKLQKCFILHDDVKDKCFYSLQLVVKCVSSLGIKSSAESQSKDTIISNDADQFSDLAIAADQEIVFETTATQNMHIDKQANDIFISKEIFPENSAKQELLEPANHLNVLDGFSDTGEINNISGSTIDRSNPPIAVCMPKRKTADIDSDQPITDSPLLCKLTPDGAVAFKCWASKSDTQYWSQAIPVNLELLHFAHRVRMPELIKHVLKNFESLEENRFTLECAIDILAAAQIYRVEMPELMRRTAHFILDKER